MDHLISPHGSGFEDLFLSAGDRDEIKSKSLEASVLPLSASQLSHLDLLLNGSYSPLNGFMGKKEAQSVWKEMRLADGVFWPLPVTLDIPTEISQTLEIGQPVFLSDPEGGLLARMTVEDLWEKEPAADPIFQAGQGEADDPSSGSWCIGGRIEGLELAGQPDFMALRKTPDLLRREFNRLGWRNVLCCQPRQPMHRADVQVTLEAAKRIGANILIQPLVRAGHQGESIHYSNIRCYQAIQSGYPPGMMMMNLLNMANGGKGARELLVRAIIAKNHGCGYFLDPQYAAQSPGGAEDSGDSGMEEIQNAIRNFGPETGVEFVPYPEMAYIPSRARYFTIPEMPEGVKSEIVDEKELMRRLREGLEIPEWFSFPEVIEELRRAYPQKNQQGITLFFTGLSGAGKSTLAKTVLSRFLEIGGRSVTLLDGDIVRKNLSSNLGFSKEHRDLNILRIGFVANEITKHGGIAICAPIAPYRETRRKIRETISANGIFVEIFVSTPLEVCEKRDRKGLYAKARKGLIKEFTGISDVYEAPENAEITIDTSDVSQEEAAQSIWLYLEKEGFIR